MFKELKTLQTVEIGTTLSSEGGKATSSQEVYVCPPGQAYGERVQTPVFVLDQLTRGDTILGPALIIDATQTIFVNA